MSSLPPPPHSPEADVASDPTLMARARRGDAAAFRALVERYEGLVAATVTGMLGPGAEAEDVGQETFIRFYHALPRYRGEGSVASYLTRIAVNLSLNALDRQKRRQQRFLPQDAEALRAMPPDGNGHEPPDFKGEELVARALHHLSPDHRAVVVLRLIDGYSTRETAALLGVPVGTVLSRLARAQHRLRTLLSPYLHEPSS